MTTQFKMYDDAMKDWVTDNFPQFQSGRTNVILLSTPRKAFSEVNAQQVADQATLIVPRYVIQRLDAENDPLRYNSNRIRHLGYGDPALKDRKITGKFPAPVIVPYQIDIVTRFIEEMSRAEQFVLDTFASSYMYLSITPNEVWGEKMYPVFLEGSIIDNSDLEPQEQDRVIRKTFTLRTECWIFDDVFIPKSVAKRIEISLRDSDSDVEYENYKTPPVEVLATGNGAATSFGPVIAARFPILTHSLVINATIGGTEYAVTDDGAGNLSGSVLSSGTVDYSTGSLTFEFSSPPDDGLDITITYFTDLS